MCGICGIYGDTNNTAVSAMVGELVHRGPDGNAVYLGDNCKLGHTRLAVLDLSERGAQPIFNETQTVLCVVNGEIYNYKELRAQLKDRGHIFRSECDSEVVVHAYEEWGQWFVERLRGMFALAVYDKAGNKLLLARDPIGKKPLYYSWDSGRLVFASEIKALFKAGIPCKVNYDAIPSFLIYQYVLGHDTLFYGIRKLQAGTMLVAEGSEFAIYKYFELVKQHSYAGDPPVILKDLLQDSVKVRLQSDVPIGVFLSGGVDSSCVAALWREQYSGDLHTFTATFAEKSEAKFAKQVSEYLGTKYHEVEITPKMVSEDIKKITWHHDEPLGDAATINTYYLAKEAKKYVTVVLAGEGGDELFGGYPWYNYSSYIDKMAKIPQPLRIAGHELLRSLNFGDIAHTFYHQGRMALFPCQSSFVDMMMYPTTATGDLTVRWLLKDGFANPEPRQNGRTNSTREQMLALDCLNMLPERLLMKGDKGTMAWAIEERLPLLDKEIIRFAFNLSDKWKTDKYVLRKAVQDLIPYDIAWRAKEGFGTPYRSWITSPEMKDMVLDRILNGKLLAEICNQHSLEKVAQIVSDAHDHSERAALSPLNVAWGLFSLQVWYDVWFA